MKVLELAWGVLKGKELPIRLIPCSAYNPCVWSRLAAMAAMGPKPRGPLNSHPSRDKMELLTVTTSLSMHSTPPEPNSFRSMLDSNHSFENQGRIVCYHECTVPSTPLRAELTHANADYYPSRENQGRTKLFTGLFRSVSQMHHNEHIQLPQGVEQAQPVVFVLHAHTNKDKKVDDMWNCSSWSSLFYMYRCWSYN